MVSSCRHLIVGMYWDGTRHHYGRCQLGDAGARLAHLKNQITNSESYVNWHADPDGLGLVPPPIMPPR